MGTITIKTFEPVDGINSEEYRAALLMEIQEIKHQIDDYTKELNKSTSNAPLVVMIISSLIAITNFTSRDFSAQLVTFSLIAFIVGIVWKLDNRERYAKVTVAMGYKYEKLSQAEEAYNYAYKHKDKDGVAIYEESESSFRSKKIYD